MLAKAARVKIFHLHVKYRTRLEQNFLIENIYNPGSGLIYICTETNTVQNILHITVQNI